MKRSDVLAIIADIQAWTVGKTSSDLETDRILLVVSQLEELLENEIGKK